MKGLPNSSLYCQVAPGLPKRQRNLCNLSRLLPVHQTRGGDRKRRQGWILSPCSRQDVLRYNGEMIFLSSPTKQPPNAPGTTSPIVQCGYQWLETIGGPNIYGNAWFKEDDISTWGFPQYNHMLHMLPFPLYSNQSVAQLKIIDAYKIQVTLKTNQSVKRIRLFLIRGRLFQHCYLLLYTCWA